MKTKHFVLWLLTVVFAVVTVSAQEAESQNSLDSLKNQVSELQNHINETEKQQLYEQIWKKRSKYFNIGYVSQTRSITDTDISLNSKFGMSLSWGKQFYLHKQPLFGMLKFAIDWSWIDINYANYEYGYNSNEDSSNTLHQIDLAMQFGVSAAVNPIDHLKVGVYFRATPTGTLSLGLGEEESAGFGYITCYNTGAFIAYKVASIGVEYRWGKGTLSNFAYNENSVANGSYNDYTSVDVADILTRDKINTKIGTLRIYFGFRF